MVENMRPDESLPYPIRIFYSYTQRDESLVEDLENHLSALKWQGHITTWHKRNISAGTEWSSETNKSLNTADIILLIISADFIASDYCYGVEMQQALARHTAKDVRVLPIIARPVDIQETPFSKLQALPSNGLSVSEWTIQDAAFVDIVRGIRKVVDELRATQAKKRRSSPARSSPFLFNQPLSDSKEFYGRLRERETLLNRTWHAASTSIVGPRRIGKTWLMHYVRLIAPQELGSKYLIGYLDAMTSRCSTVVGFVGTALEALALQKPSLATAQDSLIILEQAIQEVSSTSRVPVLCIDEFEGFGNHSEFDLDFFSSLRAMTQNGLCLLVASKTPLIDIIGECGKTSGFFNVFEQITLKPFHRKEAERFVHEKGERVGLTVQEREKLLLYGQYKGEYWPISLQLAGKTLVEDKTLAQREQDPDYYRPTEQAYWEEFEARLQEVYRGMMK
jgi:TIR domain/AAA domain